MSPHVNLLPNQIVLLNIQHGHASKGGQRLARLFEAHSLAVKPIS
jgi:hypothetical protein